jgi:16S rRNA (cytidine1402-2'-O)-methyltransferase
VLYESPERLGETLAELAALLGARRAAVARELTKVHEEIARGTLGELAGRFAGEVKGEITLVIEGAAEQESDRASDEAIAAEIGRRLAGGEGTLKEIARELAQATGRSRSEVYALGLKVKDRSRS